MNTQFANTAERTAERTVDSIVEPIAEGASHAFASLSFAQANFGQLDLGDQRRTQRLVSCVESMCRHPGGTLPDKLNRPSSLRAFYRLMNRQEVTHEILIAAHTQQTRRAIEALGSGTVLIIHDATELDYTSIKALRDQLGQIGQGTHKGYICHNSLAVHADTQETLGLTAQILHHRAKVAKKESATDKRERKDRESRLWLQGAKASGPAPRGILCVDVSDTLSDTYEYMAFEVTQHRHFLLRARENRRLCEPLQDQHYLFEAVRHLPALGEREVKVREAPPQKGKPHRPGRAARTTMAKVAFGKVHIKKPGKKAGEYDKKSLELWAVRIWEPVTPKGEKPLEWILLTNCPVLTLAQAFERIHWYELRWIVEEYHKGMKTGCGIETLQFEKIERLEPVVALLSTVATTLLRLRDAARVPDADTRLASTVVDPIYVEVLVAYSRNSGTSSASSKKTMTKGLREEPTVLAFYLHVARLGGHQNRKCDGLPGWITLWRGWMKLQQMVDGYQAALLRIKERCGTN